MREIWFATLFVLAVAGIVPAQAQPAKPDANTTKNLLAVNDQDRVLGKPEAPITIIEYASLSCPHCAHFEATVLPDLKKTWIDTGKVKLVLRDFPLDEPAMRAEMLTHCVSADRFYPLTESLFASQEKWVIAKDPVAALERQAMFAGVGKKEFEACMANKPVEDQVAQSRLTASKQLGVNSTPTFFINGQKFTGEPTIEAFNQLLNSLAAKS